MLVSAFGMMKLPIAFIVSVCVKILKTMQDGTVKEQTMKRFRTVKDRRVID
jgi:hypothetical protein